MDIGFTLIKFTLVASLVVGAATWCAYIVSVRILQHMWGERD